MVSGHRSSGNFVDVCSAAKYSAATPLVSQRASMRSTRTSALAHLNSVYLSALEGALLGLMTYLPEISEGRAVCGSWQRLVLLYFSADKYG